MLPMVVNFASLFNGKTRLYDASMLNLFQKVCAWLSIFVVGPIEVLFVVLLYFHYRSPLSPLLCFITVFVVICVSLWCFANEVEDLCVGQTYFCSFELHQNVRVRLRSSKTGLSLHPPHKVFLDSSKAALFFHYTSGFICGVCLFVPNLFFFWYLGKAVLCDCCISSVFSLLFLMGVMIFLYLSVPNITKTRLFKYTENLTTQKWKFSDKKFRYSS